MQIIENVSDENCRDSADAPHPFTTAELFAEDTLRDEKPLIVLELFSLLDEAVDTLPLRNARRS